MRTALLIKLLRLMLDAPVEKLRQIERILCPEEAETLKPETLKLEGGETGTETHTLSNALPSAAGPGGGCSVNGEQPSVAGRWDIGELLGGIHREIAAVRKEFREMRTGKERLAQMHGEGMFAFARHIDREARQQFLAIMAGGDVAKAARDLDMKDSTLRSQLERWPKRGAAYAALAEIIRWRKSIKGQAGMEFAKRVASGGERDVDFPALIRDVVAELEELAPENWEERCGDLADVLRKAVS